MPNLDARERLIKRVSQLGDVAGVRQALERILGTDGPFRDLASLNNRQSSRLFSSAAVGNPESGLASLERIIGLASPEQLLELDDGRQDIVWLLQRLLERRETFWTAARLLRRLAEAENANWANNATGVWQSIFLTMLGTTEVPAIDRLKLIDEALDDEIQEVRLLGVKGLASALHTREMSTGRGSNSSGIPPQYWSPQVWGDVWEVKRAALARLDRAMDDLSPEIRRAARSIFIDHAHDLAAMNLSEDVVQRLVQINGEDELERRRIWETINYVLKYDDANLSQDQKARLQRALSLLYGDSVLDRIRRYTGLPIYQQELFSDDANAGIERSIRELAGESLKSPNELRAAIPWLVSSNASNAFLFGRSLGELDASKDWLEALANAVKSGENPEALSGYLSGRAEAERPGWREEVIDSWSRDPDMASAVLDATMRGPRSDHAVRRVLRMIDDGLLDFQVLGWLQHGSWANAISEQTLIDVLSRLLKQGTSRAITVGLALCSDWFEKEPTGTGGVPEIAWRLLEQISGWASEPMLSLYWTEVAKHLAATDPERTAQLVVNSYVEGEATLGDRRIEVLNHVLSIAPDRVWSVVGQTLLNGRTAYRLSWILEENGLVLRVPLEIVTGWVRANVVGGAKAVASIVKPGETGLPQLVRFLLSNYGDDVGRTIAANFLSGAWSGSEAEHLEPKLAVARQWAADRDPLVRKWADNVVGRLERDLAQARLRDEEWNLR